MTRPTDLGRLRAAAARAWHGSAREGRRWGLPGALGTLLLGAASVLAFGITPPGRDALRDEERAVQQARRQAAQALQARLAAPTAIDPAQRFRAAFASADERHRRIAHLLDAAAALGLPPRRSDVRSDAGGTGTLQLGLTRVRVVMPLTGGYTALRRFVEQALRDDPTLSLDTLRFERSDSASPELRAELQWSLWMRSTDITPEPAPFAGRAVAGAAP